MIYRLPDLNRCYQDENLASWTGLDEGGLRNTVHSFRARSLNCLRSKPDFLICDSRFRAPVLLANFSV